jgi:hypothetical protein
LQANPDAILELLALPVWVEAEDGNLTSGARTQAFENLDRGCLAGAIGTEQAENLAWLDLEVNSLHGMDLAVGLFETLHGDRWGRGIHRRRKDEATEELGGSQRGVRPTRKGAVREG